LIVTTIVALVQFSAFNQAGRAYTFATTQIIPESTINFPMFYIYRDSDNGPYFQSVQCIFNSQVIVGGPCAAQYGPPGGSTICTQVNVANLAATPASNKIQCTVTLQPNSYTNPVFQMTVVGSGGIPSDYVGSRQRIIHQFRWTAI